VVSGCEIKGAHVDIEIIDDSHPTASSDVQLRDIQKSLPLRVLSESDWIHWITKGFVVVRNAVPEENTRRLVELLWTFDEKDPDDPSTWYAPQRREHKMLELNNTGMLEIYNHQFLWDNRMTQRVYDAFVDIWDREDLWVGIDRANLNPPKKKKGNRDGFIHWDVDTSLSPLPVGVQGILSLLPQTAETGGFQCVPYLFEHFEEWKQSQPDDRNPKHPDTTGLEVVSPSLNAGDLLIFNSLLPHGVRPNHSDGQARMAQYISMYPASSENTGERDERVRLWREQESPDRDAFPGDPREWEKNHSDVAKLNKLGEKLLGLQGW